MDNCFSKILNSIVTLQQNTDCQQDIDNSCMRPFLGTPANIECYNTRPVTFYGCNNNLITINYTITNEGTTEEGTSSVFRVERVDDDTVLVNILMENPDTTQTNRPYVTTNNTAIINLNCVCAIKCLNDTIVNL